MPTQIRWPLALDEQGRIVEVEQDTHADVLSTGSLIAETRPGQAWWDPTLGVPSPLGANDPEQSAERIQDALQRQEPRGKWSVVVQPQEIPSRQILLDVTVEA